MKKYLPASIITVVFLGYLITQVALRSSETNARIASKSSTSAKHFEDIFKKYSFKDMKGETYQDLTKNHKVVLVNFWAQWCRPCIEEMPSLVSLRKKYKKEDLFILSINTDEEKDLKKVKKTIKEESLNFPVIRDTKGDLTSKFMISAVPVTIIYTREKKQEVINEPLDFVSGEFLEKINSYLK